LVVDDDFDVRESVAIFFALSGVRAETAADGAEALAHLRDHPPPAVILLDLTMPRMSGAQFLAERANEPALAAVPVVVVSATTDPDTRARLPGVAAFHPKPAEPTELLATVRRLLVA
jgi:CheY-like chemotaxis protein